MDAPTKRSSNKQSDPPSSREGDAQDYSQGGERLSRSLNTVVGRKTLKRRRGPIYKGPEGSKESVVFLGQGGSRTDGLVCLQSPSVTPRVSNRTKFTSNDFCLLSKRRLYDTRYERVEQNT